MSAGEPEGAGDRCSGDDGRPGEAGLCVLVVEDDDAYLIERALRANPDVGTVVRAVDGVEALHLLETGAVDPDLAFIDLNMPRRSGFHVLVDLASRRPAAFPMVVLTSSRAPTAGLRSWLRGAVRVLTKPDSAEELEPLLAEAVSSARARGRSPRSLAPAPEQHPHSREPPRLPAAASPRRVSQSRS